MEFIKQLKKKKICTNINQYFSLITFIIDNIYDIFT